MSSHREAPEISKDPVADSTDLYAFVSPDDASSVTLIANYIPLQHPDGGPNFYEFGDDVLYAIHVDNDGDGAADVTFELRFTTTDTAAAGEFFLYNTGTITFDGSTFANWSRPQTYTLTRVDEGGRRTELGSGLPVPPCNIGPLSTPNYASTLAGPSIKSVGAGGYHAKVFAGQRAEGFYVDLGSIFDLGTLRPIEELHAPPGLLGATSSINSTDGVNVHSIALQVPISELTSTRGTPNSPTAPGAVIGVWTTASRQKVRIDDRHGVHRAGPFVQVSRLGNPLVNEVLIPLAKKDLWNSLPPSADSQFVAYFSNPGLAQLLPGLYPGAFPHLAAYNAGSPDRADLVAVLLTGIPAGVVGAGFTTFTGTTQADMLRLNVAVTPASNPNILGVLGGDVAGFPNGRRVFDDVATIELKAVAGATLPLVDPKFTADGAVADVTFGYTKSLTDTTIGGTEHYLGTFPYLGTPHSGYNAHTPAGGAAGG